MRLASASIGVLVASCVGWPAGLRAQVPKAETKAAPRESVVVRPVQVDLLSLQVSKLPRDGFGHAVKPATNESVAFWLANSGTAVDLRIKLDRSIARFDEAASRLVRFADDKDHDLRRPPEGMAINTFFPENKPILLKPGPGPDEAEVILRGYGTPTPGATKLSIHADLVFVGGSGERTIESEVLEPTPGTEATVGPLRLRFEDPETAGPFGQPLRGLPGPPGRIPVAFSYQRLKRPIKSVTCLDSEGDPVATLDGLSFDDQHGGMRAFFLPRKSRIALRVVYYEKSGTITVPIRLEMGVGF